MNQILKKYFFKNSIHFFDGIVLLSFMIFSWWLMASTFGYEDGKLLIASKLWSDFAAHIPLVRSFSHGLNIPPEYPLFPGEPIRYHFLFYFLVGFLEKIGLNIALAMNILSAAGFTLLLWMIYKISNLFFQTRKAGILAVFLFLMNGSLSFVEYFQRNSFSIESVRQIFHESQFLSFGPWDGGKISAFWNLNIYTNQRHLGLSFGLLLLLIWPLLKMAWEKTYAIKHFSLCLILVVFFFFPLLHQAASVALFVFVSGWIGVYFLDKIILKKNIFVKNKNTPSILFVYGAGLCALLLSFLVAYGVGGDHISWNIGYLSNTKDFWELVEYWFYNLGLYVFLYPFLILWVTFKKIANSKNILRISFCFKKNQFPILLFVLIFSTFFIAANLFQLSPDMINNHKFINIFMIGMNILVAGFLAEKWSTKRWMRIIVIALFFVLTFSGFIDFFPVKNDSFYEINDFTKSDIVDWIENNTERDAIFLATTYIYNPASIAGRKLFIDHGYFAWSLGYNDRQRRNKIPFLFSPTLNSRNWCELMNANALDSVILSPGKGELGDDVFIEESFVVRNVQPVFVSEENYRVYDVKKYCNL